MSGIIDERKFHKVKLQLQANERKLNGLCLKLAEIDSFFPVGSVSGVKKISSKWLRNYINGILASINDDQRLPQSFKDEIAQHWEAVWDKAHEICDQISLITNFNGVALRKRGGVFMYGDKELQAFAEKEATITLDDEQAEYLSVLQAVAKSLNDASEWEKSHGYHNTAGVGVNVEAGGEYRHIDLQSLLQSTQEGYSLSPETFVLMMDDGVLGKEV